MNRSNSTAGDSLGRGPYIILGLIETICFSVGTPGSVIILSYFIHKILRTREKSASTLLFTCISFVDIVISLQSFSMAVTSFNFGKEMLFANKLHCHLWGWSDSINDIMSILLIAILSVARTVSLAFPFYKVRRIHVIIPAAVLLVLVTFQFSCPFFFGEKPGYEFGGYDCEVYLSRVFNNNSFWYKFYQRMIAFGCHLAPFIVICISCCVSVYELRADNATLGNSASAAGKIKRDATITILILTVGYISLNLPMICWQIILFHYPKFLYLKVGKYIQLVDLIVQIILVHLNSLFNIFVYFYRMKDLRDHTKRLFCGAKEELFTQSLNISRRVTVSNIPQYETGLNSGTII